MSTFLLALGDGDRLAPIRRALERGADTDELVVDRIGATNRTVLAVAKPGGIVVETGGSGSLALGWSLDHRSRTVRVGPTALVGHESDDGAARREGVFVDARWSAGGISIRRDALGQYPVLWTDLGRGTVVVSDSAMLLRRCRDLVGAPVDPVADEIVARSWTQIVSRQLMSSSTMCRQIRYLPAGDRLELRIASRGVEARLVARSDLLPDRVTGEGSYRESLLGAAQEMASGITSIARAFPDRVGLSLSGGLDSRILLAAVALDQAVLHSISITTGVLPAHAADRQVVERLADAVGFPFNRASDSGVRRPRVHRPFVRWVLASLGVYDQVITRVFLKPAPSLDLGGHGGEALRGGPGRRVVREIGSTDVRTRRRALHRRLRAGLRDIGVPVRSPDGAYLHWLHYRSPLHAGVPVGQGSPFAYRPLNSRRLYALAQSPHNPFPHPAKGRLSVATDLLSVLGVDMARVPFAGGSASITFDAMDERHRTGLGGAVVQSSELDAYRVLGHPDDLGLGPPAAFFGMLVDYHVDGASHTEQIHDRVLRSWGRLSDTRFAEWYRPHLDVVVDAHEKGVPSDLDRVFRVSSAKILGTDLWTS